ncbi:MULTISPECIES: ABC transporter ATP-binding protein [Eubacteriales]|uniref:ABC transporter ATP-binding protein n=2 Tax=Clostridia TaxID=186801 RepID=UPI00067F37EF|nr:MULTISPECIES: ABC transporter ATP-binding protein [Eubacteriales]MBS5505544.1 ABC transporter ATP-binding protein [Oscillospiraceae bacterium]MCB5924472.1 ABC transporter ATP-binding protein [bacterium 210820-DFI.5.26]MCQ5158263.1 ABC transporter ATP-binding protein [Clostridium sp. DFI.5.61]UMM45596.1 ABC transporter ATP-binding protein [Lawsonibacter asaccharolyticus]GBF70369.1 osmoprotectant transport system ATP-binding protein [Lawsonibacter asaccharolyticus]
MLRFDHVSLSYGSQKILNDLCFEIEEGQFAVLIGPSGCGKTTTLKMINRLIQPDTGKIYLNEEDITSKDKVELRRHIGYVIQQIGLFPNMTVAQNICVVPKLLKYSKEQCDQIVRDMLAMVEMPYEQYANKYPSEMSGGQQQRIGILRALAASPPIVLMDEPFSALDPMTRRSLQQEVKGLQQKLHKTFIFVTHDMAEALDLADVIIFMDHGNIVQMAPPEEMLAHPASGQIQDFLGNFIDTHAQKELTAADFMRSGVSTVSARRGVNECVSKMQRRNVDTLIVVDDQDRYQGTVSIADIRLTGHVVKTIEPLIRCNTPTVHTGDSAKDCFDLLISSGAPYLIVLNEEEKVDGIITKTSMTSAMAEQLWG